MVEAAPGDRPGSDVVEIAARIHVIQVCACREQGLVHRHDRQQRFQRTGGAEQVAVDGLGGRDRGAVRPCTEHLAQGRGFDHVAAFGGGGMGVDVVDRARIQRGIRERCAQCTHLPFRRGHADVVGIVGNTVARQVTVAACATRLRVLDRFQDQEGGTLAHHQPRTVPGKRLATARDIARIWRGHGARALEHADDHRRQRRFGAPGDGDVEITVGDGAGRLADGDAGRTASGRVGDHRAQHLLADRDLRRAGVAHDCHRGIRAGCLLALEQQLLHPRLSGRGAAIDVAVIDACALAEPGKRVEAGIVRGLARCQDRHLLATIEEGALELGEGFLEGSLDRTRGKATLQRGHVDQADAGTGFAQRSGNSGHVEADRGNHTQTGNGNLATHRSPRAAASAPVAPGRIPW